MRTPLHDVPAIDWREGYTPDMMQSDLRVLNTVLVITKTPGTLICLWEDDDAEGFHGGSELHLLRHDDIQRPWVIPMPMPYLEDDADPAVLWNAIRDANRAWPAAVLHPHRTPLSHSLTSSWQRLPHTAHHVDENYAWSKTISLPAFTGS